MCAKSQKPGSHVRLVVRLCKTTTGERCRRSTGKATQIVVTRTLAYRQMVDDICKPFTVANP